MLWKIRGIIFGFQFKSYKNNVKKKVKNFVGEKEKYLVWFPG